MRSAPVARSISTRTSGAAQRGVGGADPVVLGRWKFDAGALEASEFAAALAHGQRVDLGRQFLPAIGKLACDHAQREKPCATAPVTPLRACALAAIAGKRQRHSPA